MMGHTLPGIKQRKEEKPSFNKVVGIKIGGDEIGSGTEGTRSSAEAHSQANQQDNVNDAILASNRKAADKYLEEVSQTPEYDKNPGEYLRKYEAMQKADVKGIGSYKDVSRTGKDAQDTYKG